LYDLRAAASTTIQGLKEHLEPQHELPSAELFKVRQADPNDGKEK